MQRAGRESSVGLAAVGAWLRHGLALGLGLALMPGTGRAEPYLAVESGLKCAQCHVSGSGGGQRTAFGTLYARNQIAARVLAEDSGASPWTGEVNRWFAVGGNFRGGYESIDVPGVADESDFDVTRATVYADVRLVPNLVSLYIDERIAPDDAVNREAYLSVTPQNGKFRIKAGQLFLPFGLRLQDDRAFVRQASGINFNAPDDGIELGLELPKWSAQLAVSEGNAGGGNKSGSSNQLSLSAVYVQPRWRVGFSHNVNDDPLGDREMQAVFAGFRTGPISWLAEIDLITDETALGDRDLYASLIEGNWRLRKGHNLKLSYGYLDPDRDVGEDQQERYSLIWEYSPMQFVQSRVGLRAYNGVPNIAISNRDELFAELHVYF